MLDLSANDLPQLLGDPWFCQTRMFHNMLETDSDGLVGYNWLISQHPSLIHVDTNSNGTIDTGEELIAYKGDLKPVYFQWDGSQFQPILDRKDEFKLESVTLDDGASSAGYRLTLGIGHGAEQVYYYSPHGAKQGVFYKHVSASGEVTKVTSYQYNKPLSLDRLVGSTLYSISYSYYTSGAVMKLESVKLAKTVGATTTDIRRVEYTYYGYGGTGDTYGQANDLKTVTIQKPDGSGGWDDVSVTYYRYYTSADPASSQHRLKYVVNAESYRLLQAAYGDPLAASNAQVAEYADFYFEYDSSSRVSKEVALAGCSSCSGGAGTRGDTFTRTIRSGYVDGTDDGFNHWKMKVQIDHPDGSSQFVYTNYNGDPLLMIQEKSGQRWATWYRYNSDGLKILTAHPSAVQQKTNAQYEAYDDLVNFGGGGSSYLQQSSGLIEVSAFYGSTTATSSVAGGAVNYLQYQAVKNGETGSEVRIREFKYFARTENGENVFPLAQDITYPVAGSTGTAYEIDYAYTYHSSSAVIESVTTTLPAVSTAQNGSNASNTTVQFYDIKSRPTWFKDQRGVITRQIYDEDSDTLTQRIEDVDTTQVSDEPSGWTTAGSFGQHLVTDYSYDNLNRLARVLGPAHSVDLAGSATTVRSASWVVYDEQGPLSKDQIRSASGYQKTSDSSFTLVNPVAIRIQGKDGKQVYEAITATRSSTSGALSSTDTFAQSSYVSWTADTFNSHRRRATTQKYHTIPSSGSGSAGTNYDQTAFSYDSDTDNLVRTLTADGTTSRTVYAFVNGNYLPASTWIGTDDTGATLADPSDSGSNNMKAAGEYEYDGGSAGADGNLTQITLDVDGSTSRVTTYGYDFRNRRVSADGEINFYAAYTYDNFNRLIQEDRKDTSSGGHLIARTQTNYDAMGRVYRTSTFEVDPSTGTVGQELDSNLWYDAAGHVAKTQPGGTKLFTKMAYDGLGRITAVYSAYDTDETAYADAATLTGDTVMEQSENAYDEEGNVLLVTDYQRNHDDDSTTGALTTSFARRSYNAMWYAPAPIQGGDRLIATANYGTNNGSSLSRPTTTPSASDTILVSLTSYDDAGRAVGMTDPKAIVNRTFYDDAGRATYVVENYKSGSTYWNGTLDGDGNPVDVYALSPKSRSSDECRITGYTYTAAGKLATMTAVDPNHDGSTSDDQVTKYVYGVTLSDSALASNRLLRAVIYPDSDDQVSYGTYGAPSLTDGTDSTYDRVESSYDRQGQTLTRKDQREVVHTYNYDALGRLLHDRVTGTGRMGEHVDAAVLRISRTYDVRGLLTSVASYDNATAGSGSVLNESAMAYNGFAQLVTDYQEHSGAKDGSTLSTALAYEDGSDATKGIRPTKLTYPNGREVYYLYAEAGDTAGLNDVISRVTSIATATTRGTSDANVIASYQYLGLDSPVIKNYPAPSVQLDYFGGTPGSYTGVDRFGRIIDHKWTNAQTTPTVLSREQHTYDRASNRLTSTLPLNTNWNESYTYDDLHRLTDFARNSGGNVPRDLAYALDQANNWTSFTINGGTAEARVHNAANEITSVASDSTAVATDASGNMTKIPAYSGDSAHSGHRGYIYDAWNRLVEVQNDAMTPLTLAQYAYDGLGRRISQVISNSGGLNATYHYYYAPGSQQVIEERNASGGSGGVLSQQVWGLSYVDELCQQLVNGDPVNDPDFSSSDPDHDPKAYYALQDASYNVTQTFDASGALVERYAYDPYGRRTAYTPVDGSDAFGLDAQAQPTRVKVGGVDQAYPIMPFGHQGLLHDEADDLVYNRARYFDTHLGRFINRDPLGYVDGMSLYAYYPGMYGGMDPSGQFGSYLIDWVAKKIQNASLRYLPDSISPYVGAGAAVIASEARSIDLARHLTEGGIDTYHAVHDRVVLGGDNPIYATADEVLRHFTPAGIGVGLDEGILGRSLDTRTYGCPLSGLDRFLRINNFVGAATGLTAAELQMRALAANVGAGAGIPRAAANAPAEAAESAGASASRSLSERIADFQQNPQNWERVSASAEQATARSAKGGVSVESSYRNTVTGENLHVHDVYKPSGTQIPNHPTYRDYGKGG